MHHAVMHHTAMHHHAMFAMVHHAMHDVPLVHRLGGSRRDGCRHSRNADRESDDGTDGLDHSCLRVALQSKSLAQCSGGRPSNRLHAAKFHRMLY